MMYQEKNIDNLVFQMYKYINVTGNVIIQYPVYRKHC
jgi:hypothetical protein